MWSAAILLLCGKLSFGSKLGSPRSEDEKSSERNEQEWYKHKPSLDFNVSSITLKKSVFQSCGGSL